MYYYRYEYTTYDNVYLYALCYIFIFLLSFTFSWATGKQNTKHYTMHIMSIKIYLYIGKDILNMLKYVLL